MSKTTKTTKTTKTVNTRESKELDAAAIAYVKAESGYLGAEWTLGAHTTRDGVTCDVINNALARAAEKTGVIAKFWSETKFTHVKNAYGYLGGYLESVPQLANYAPASYYNRAKASRLKAVKSDADAIALVNDMAGLMSSAYRAQSSKAKDASKATKGAAKDAGAVADTVKDVELSEALKRLQALATALDSTVAEVLGRAIDLLELSLEHLDLDDDEVVELASTMEVAA